MKQPTSSSTKPRFSTPSRRATLQSAMTGFGLIKSNKIEKLAAESTHSDAPTIRIFALPNDDSYTATEMEPDWSAVEDDSIDWQFQSSHRRSASSQQEIHANSSSLETHQGPSQTPEKLRLLQHNKLFLREESPLPSEATEVFKEISFIQSPTQKLCGLDNLFVVSPEKEVRKKVLKIPRSFPPLSPAKISSFSSIVKLQEAFGSAEEAATTQCYASHSGGHSPHPNCSSIYAPRHAQGV